MIMVLIKRVVRLQIQRHRLGGHLGEQVDGRVSTNAGVGLPQSQIELAMLSQNGRNLALRRELQLGEHAAITGVLQRND